MAKRTGKIMEKECVSVKGNSIRFLAALLLVLVFASGIVCAVPTGTSDVPAASASSPSSSGAQRFRFVVLGDIHMGWEGGVNPRIGQIMPKIINELRPSFVIQVGDIINIRGGTSDRNCEHCIDTMWSRVDSEIVGPLTSNGILFFPVSGNHDGTLTTGSLGSEMSKAKHDQYWSLLAGKNRNFGVSGPGYGRYYSFDYNNVHFIGLLAPGTEGLRHSAEQFAWLEQDIAQARSRGVSRVFTFAHSPLKAPAIVNPKERSEQEFLAKHRPTVDALKSLVSAGIPVTHFAGHIHVHNEAEFEGIRDIISGPLGGGRSTPSSTGVPQPWIFMVVDVDGNDVQMYSVTAPDFNIADIPGAPVVSSPVPNPTMPASVASIGVCPPGTRPAQARPAATAPASSSADVAVGAAGGGSASPGSSASSALEHDIDETMASAGSSSPSGAAITGAVPTSAESSPAWSEEPAEPGSDLVSDSAAFASELSASGTTTSLTGCGARIAAVGDSLTAKQSYVQILDGLCGTGTEMRNEDGDASTSQDMGGSDKFSFEGKRVGTMLNDFGDVLGSSFNPDTIIIMGGTNNVGSPASGIISSLRQMYTQAKDAGKRVVAVTIPPYKSAAGNRRPEELETIRALNAWILSADNPADIKVDIYSQLVSPGTDDVNPTYFGSDPNSYHVNGAGKRRMAEIIHAELTGAPAVSVSVSASAASPGASASALSPVAVASSTICVPDSVLPQTLYDFIINSSAGITTIVGIARQNIAVGINKTRRAVTSASLCQPIGADLNYDLDALKRTYGQSQLDVESQLVDASFMSQPVRVHRLVEPAFGCVQRDIRNCRDARDYVFSIESYRWEGLPSDPEMLSTNSFGIAVDINIGSNPCTPAAPPSSEGGELGVVTDLPQCVVDAFKRYGFRWGGDYTDNTCPAHFEFMADPSRIVVQEDIQCPPGTALVTVPSDSAEARTSSSNGAWLTSASPTPGSLVGNSDFVWPIPESSAGWNNIVSCYGPRTLSGNPGYHDGIDIGISTGTPLVAIAGGTVHWMCRVAPECRCTIAQEPCATNCRGQKSCSGFGNTVVIKIADNLYAHYVHMDSIAEGIVNGAHVSKGQQIGTVGNTGYSGGSHLHFAIYNEWPRHATGNPDYPEIGRNPFCFFPDSILTRLNVHRTNCPAVYGGEGQIISSTHPKVVQDCQQADLSALGGLTPTPAESVPVGPAPGQPAMVQVCRPESAAAGPMTTEPLGTERIVKCSTGECIAQMAEYYSQRFRTLPYIWGGVTPYDPAQTKELVADRNSFFHGAYVHYPNQPGGNEFRSGKPTIAGFDCSGFVWWVFKHAGIPGFSTRKGATGQRDYGISNGQLVACNPTGEEINRVGRPGDLVFWKSGGETVNMGGCVLSESAPHVAVYVGGGQIIESGGTRRNPPTDIDYTDFFRTYGTANPARYGGIQKVPISAGTHYGALVRYNTAPDATVIAFNAAEFESASSSGEPTVMA
ncbi:peptidoglycan DD-metalloendopeptidase family protein [Candidatus Woesearchaeota archaeon]|nr:peptidoglycan DD-metalloendopeptidase family protein [Candidatus Woesearchaeota archaeon]